MLIEQTAINAQTMEDIQNHLESTTIDHYWREPQWDPQQDVALTIAETIQQVKQANSLLRPEQRESAPEHLEAASQALKQLTGVNSRNPATPEQQMAFEQAWRHLEDARLALCVTAYERLRPILGIVKDAPPDLSSHPYMWKHNLISKEDEQC